MQALIITAYKNTNQLIKLIESTVDKFLLFIHIDKKSSIDINQIEGKGYNNLRLSKTYNVTWGGIIIY
jgi:hypothetical protein